MAIYDSRILAILIPRPSARKDAYRNEALCLRPSSFSKVFAGHGLSSTAALFKIPAEILAGILEFVDADSLASLALVNRDSLQLARSRKFASILLDYSPQSLSLIEFLLEEGAERATSTTSSSRHPSLGTCIRKVTVVTDPRYVTARHNVSFDNFANEEEDTDSWTDETNKTRMTAMEHAALEFCDNYIPNIGAVLDSTIMPHVETLDWQDQVIITPLFLKILFSSSIKHLKFKYLRVTRDFQIEKQDVTHSGGWPLQTLHFDLIWDFFNSTRGSMGHLCTSLLRLCARTLVSLAWAISSPGDVEPSDLMTCSDDQWHFPSLRKLKLASLPLLDSTVLEALVTESLKVLIINTEAGSVYHEYFQHRGTIASLETFVWETVLGPNQSLEFLKSNPQLKKICIQHPIPPPLLEGGILPLLSSSFKHLQSLALIWDCDLTPVSALNILSTLETLQQIHLSAGTQHGWRYDWLIDHQSIQNSLSCLRNLKKIAFSRDSYPDGSYHGFYYEHRSYVASTLNPADDEVMELHNAGQKMTVWEILHRRQMIEIANKYATLISALEWIYVGQLPISVKAEASAEPASIRQALPLCDERDECKTYLSKTFGGNMDED